LINRMLENIALSSVVMGLGTWAWGDRLYLGYYNGYTKIDLEQAFAASLSLGIRFFDTAKSYGQGESERLLGHFIRNCQQNERANILMASKFMPYPWRLSRSSLIDSLKANLKRIGIRHLDLDQLHWPFPPVPIRVWMEAMAEAMEKNLIASVGV